MNYLTRRRFLQALGAFGCAAPLGRMLYSSVAQAAGQPNCPKRFIALMSPHGMLTEYWRPRGTENSFDIDFANSMLGPLNAFKNKLVILDGVDYKILYEKGQTGHNGGPCTFLTGTTTVERAGEVYPVDRSVDQAIAEHLNPPSETASDTRTPFRSLELGVFRQGGEYVASSMVYGPGGVRIPSQIDPAALYRRLFGTQAGSQRPSLINYLQGEISTLENRLAGPEREKLQSHMEALNSIETRLSLQEAALQTCTIPGAPSTLDPRVSANIPQIIDLQFDLMIEAFKCDLTRVVTFHFLQAGDPTPMPWIGPTYNKDLHDGMAHFVGEGATAANLELVGLQRWYASQVAGLLQRLEATPEDGGTMLDNTLILWGNELGQPAAHSSINIPLVLAGGAGGAYQTGRYLTYSQSENPRCDGAAGNCPANNPNRDQTPHNQVLTSILNAFGVPAEFFGDKDYSGALPNLV
ncbi:MAG: DUF1552 domain-containing protein [Myxococcota bacterium]